MAPHINQPSSQNGHAEEVSNSAILHPNLSKPNIRVAAACGNYFQLHDGRSILDASGGPAVTCIGHGDRRVLEAITEQMSKLSFCHSLYWGNGPAELLARRLVDSTNQQLTKCTFYGSGSEAIEAAMKLACQYHVNLGNARRTHFIARRGAFHGTTLGALALTEGENKRRPFGAILPSNVSFVDACHPYRGLKEGETPEQYLDRLASELEAEFLNVGPDNVCAFVAETIAGSGLGCAPPIRGYFKAVRALCDKYGVLLILDEVMCGMGRTGTVHAWQQESVVPDIQAVAKGLGAGYAPISAILINPKVLAALTSGMGFFNHGHTYQSHAVACAAALEVQRIIQETNMLENVVLIGKTLGEGLKHALQNHQYVGDIRGRGALWAIEFVRDKATKEPFAVEHGIARGIRQRGLEHHGISLQPYSGTVDGLSGDHIMLSPPYNVTSEDLELIIEKTKNVIVDFFDNFST